jgi:hypothetical protein
MSEIEWRPIPGWEDYYEVSNHGEIRSLDRVVTDGKVFRGKPKALKLGNNGYVHTSLYRGGQAKYSTVHRLVMLTFVGPRPVGHDICHRNGVRVDNRVENLYYGTRSENNLDKRAHGTDHNAKKTHCKHGHEFNIENTYWCSTGGRACKRCHSIRDARRRATRRTR